MNNVDRAFKIPQKRRIALFIGLYAFFLGTLYFSVVNIARYRNYSIVTIMCSVVWIFIVAGNLVLNVSKAGGVRKCLLHQLSMLSSKHFVWVVTEHDTKYLKFGYQLFGVPLYRASFDVQRLLTIEWLPGQATSLSGSDQDDWHVYVWYTDLTAKRYISPNTYRHEAVEVLGPPRTKAITERFGEQFLEFLRANGVPLHQGKHATLIEN